MQRLYLVFALILRRLCMIPASILHAVGKRIVLLFKLGTCAAQYTSPADIREDRYFTQCIIVLAHLNIVLLPNTTTTTTRIFLLCKVKSSKHKLEVGIHVLKKHSQS
jgi:hypothetical protein